MSSWASFLVPLLQGILEAMPPIRRIALILLAALACRGTSAPSPALGGATPDSAAIRRDIAYLASDALEGRGTGTPGNDSAAAYIARRYAALGLAPIVAATGDAGACGGPKFVLRADVGSASADRSRCRSFLQPFTARSAAAAHAGRPSALATSNVVAVVPGTDPTLRHQYVVVGAHFDHLGRSAESALDASAGDAIRNGADDNASGTAAVLELARLVERRPARRSVVFVNFSGEELGVLGSQYFVEHSPVPVDSMQAMLNFDMVGRLRDSKLIVYGVATATELPAVLDSAQAGLELRLSAIGDGFGPSDHASFYARGIPVLHFFTGLHDDYHRATDDVDRVDVAGEARVVALAERVLRDLADRPARLTAVRVAAPAMQVGPREGSNVYLGTVPDMSAGDVAGLRLTGVRPGGPAERAGLAAGDVIVEFGGAVVTDLQTYSDALYSHKPGDVVEIVVLRGGERRIVKATLGERGK